MSKNDRKKMTREEKSKRAVRKARRREARVSLKKQIEAVARERRELEARAKLSGIEIAKPSDLEGLGEENMK